MIESVNLNIVVILTFGFCLASFLGYITQRMRLSPILGYLLGGYIIGPYSPGFVADLHIAEELAEIGIILMMFEVGIHFDWKDLVSVKGIAIPGAIGQIAIAVICAALLTHQLGWPIETGLIFGLAVGVASTVVLARILHDNNLLNTTRGHIAIGWLIVEDIFTVAVLLLLPTIADYIHGTKVSAWEVGSSVLIVLLKFVVLAVIMLTFGRKVVSWTLFKVARTRSHELFTLSILAMIFAIATGSTLVFGTSIALGAFLAGMVIGQTDVRYEASANALPIKDAFVVLFFVSVGMLFNPKGIFEHPALFLGMLGIIIILKPLAAFFITLALRYPIKTALTIAIALAQIGEFSFILSQSAANLKIFPDEGYDVIVACAIISISLNPLLFRGIEGLGMYLERKRFLPKEHQIQTNQLDGSKRAIIIGYGPIGKSAEHLLEKEKIQTIVIDRNIDTIVKLSEAKKFAVFGDATDPQILKSALIEKTEFLVITNPEIESTMRIINAARKEKPDIKILARVRYHNDKEQLDGLGVHFICGEDESAKAFDALLYNVMVKS